MILDRILLSKINIIGKSFLKKANIEEYPHNINEMARFLNTLKESINNNEFEGVLIGNILFSFVSDLRIRDRNTTSRIFEDIFSALFSKECRDTSSRSNPKSIPEIIALDALCKNDDWLISTDLAGNKREKADLTLWEYNISLKTLKGPAIGPNGEVLDSNSNDELNVGSLSFRALLKGILSDDEISMLGDRKSGLGSGKQLRENVFNPILKQSKKCAFQNRLSLYLNYVYEEDVYIVLKSHYRIDFYLILNKSFIDSILQTYIHNESNFEKIFYRWENNNLRLRWRNMIQAMDTYELPYTVIEINLKNSFHNDELKKFKEDLSIIIEDYIKQYMINRDIDL